MNQEFIKVHPEGVKNIIAVASGKGGVGKSTVAANLAIALVRNGFSAAIVDADVYGPSIPHMFGLENARCEFSALGDKQMILPPEKFGVKIMSVGFLMPAGQPLIWRGPLASKLIMQLFNETVFGDTDFLVIDFPPGTGDVQLTILQQLNLAGAIIVTTPQQIALDDVRRAASMFTKPELNVPILGIIENMSWFTPASHPDEKYFVFGKGGGQKIADEFNTRLLGQIPLVAEIGEAADQGRSVFNQSYTAIAETFEVISGEIISLTNADK